MLDGGRAVLMQVLVGMGAIILNDAQVGEESVIAAGTVIPEGMVVPPRSLVMGVPGKFLYFPEEGHWVNKPQNSVLWQREFFGWLDGTLKVKP